ncbi:acyl-coenzyme A thioesterase PaaI-like protein [Blastococcus colisei]|uniref:Acyl-coenzyme A thioesterase PaaI-like protein n=1 Tax=Blastococcus colisei TaxID=1564162 RepID=A0A543P253_9ACTN|nr:PaaI family thioesterase [Blastococcus colisei]TQN38030.1 acyl-coenzyme A thioesterase PaaI-like protein [Blastococcus colisei]
MTARLALVGPADGPGEVVDAVRARALESVARTRAVGPHFFGNFVGITGLPRAEGRSRLHLALEPGDPTGGRISPTAVATVADLTMSASIRAVLGPQRRLGTITMALHHLEPVVVGPLTTDAVATRVEVEEERGFARCDLRDPRGVLVAAVEAWFVAMPTPPGRTLGPVPWELPDDVPVPPVGDGELTDSERMAVEACAEAGRRAAAGGTSVVEELLGGSWTPAGDDGVRGELSMGPAHANRGGHVQGGVLYGAAALGAQRVVAEGMSLAEGHLAFLAPAEGDVLVVESRVLRHGRRTSFAESRLHVGDRLVATGEFAFHRVPGGSQA